MSTPTLSATDIFNVTRGIASKFWPIRGTVSCKTCGWTRTVKQYQKFTPVDKPVEYFPPEDLGCPRCQEKS